MRLSAIVVTAIFVTLLLGLWIDRQFGISPCGLLLFTIIGVATSTLGVYRIVQDSYRKDAPPKEGQ
jgi:F0F1-type ATP synthase assembly protein I